MANKQQKKQPSRFQYFLWIIAGSEIEVVKKCTTGNIYNKHAGIGSMILVTTLVAILIGSVAGYKFSDSYGVAICVGLVWGLIIFTIDRNMVMFLKKDPNSSVWPAVLTRAILAFFISIFISIPLELIIFEEDIFVQMQKEKDKEFGQRQIMLDSLFKIENQQIVRDSIDNRIDDLRTQILQLPTGDVYKNKVAEYKGEEERLKLKQEDHAKKYSQRIIYHRQSLTLRDSLDNPIPDRSSRPYRLFQELYRQTKSPNGTLTVEITNLKSRVNELKKEKENIEREHQKGLAAELREKEIEDSITTITFTNDTSAVSNTLTEYEELLTESDGFTRQWTALNNVETPWVHYLIWLIRAIIFIIELAPTVLKAISYDLYDKTLKEDEEVMIKKISQKNEAESTKDVDNFKKSLDQVSKVQNELTESLLEKWKEKMEEKMDEKVEDFIN